MEQPQGSTTVCKEYGDLMHLVRIGAYSEHDDGSYWYEDIPISARIDELDHWASKQGLTFYWDQESNTWLLDQA